MSSSTDSSAGPENFLPLLVNTRIVVFAINSLVFLISAPLLVYFRYMLPIRFRTWTLSLFDSSCLWLASGCEAVFSAIASPPSPSSSTPNTNTTSPTPITGGSAFLLRAVYILWLLSLGALIPIYIRHHFLLRTSKLQQLISSGGVGSNTLIFEIQKLRIFTSEKRAWLVFLATIFLPLTAVVIAAIVLNSAQYTFAANMLLLFQSLILIFFTLWYLTRSPNDNLGIKSQFISAASLIALYTLIVLYCYLTKNTWIGAEVLGSVIPCIVFIVLIGWPIIVCLRMSRLNASSFLGGGIKERQRNNSFYNVMLSNLRRKSIKSVGGGGGGGNTNNHSTNDSPLNHILSSPSLTHTFSLFLQKEYAVENLLFVQAIERYREASHNAEYEIVLQMRNEIINTYVAEHSPNQVNLPGNMVLSLLEALKSTYDARSSILLLEADQHIRQLISENSLNRFFKELEEADPTY